MDIAFCCSNHLPQYCCKHSGNAESAVITSTYEPWPPAQHGQILITQANYILWRRSTKVEVLFWRRYSNTNCCWSYTDRGVGDEVRRWLWW